MQREAATREGICPYVAYINRNTNTGLFRLSMNSVLNHKEGCSSVARPTSREVANTDAVNVGVLANNSIRGSEIISVATSKLTRMAPGEVKVWTAYRARNIILRAGFKNFATDFQKLPIWGAQFTAVNPGSRFDIQTTEEGRFDSMFVGIGAARDIARKTGLPFGAIDACFMKHPLYNNGELHIFAVRDGENAILPVAIGLYQTESSATYASFCENIIAFGGKLWFRDRECIIFHDGFKGTEAFVDGAECGDALCFKHVIGSMRQHLRRKAKQRQSTSAAGASCRDVEQRQRESAAPQRHRKRIKRAFRDDLAWSVQKATSSREYESQLATFRKHNSDAAEYLSNLDVKKWATYALLEQGYHTFGHSTSNIVEALNGVFVDIRKEHPLQCVDSIVAWTMKKLSKRRDHAKELQSRNAILTHYAKTLSDEQRDLMRAGQYMVIPSTDEVFYVERAALESTRYIVDVTEGTCTCPDWCMYQLPCRHIWQVGLQLGLFDGDEKMREFFKKFTNPALLSSNYATAYQEYSIQLPRLDDSCGPCAPSCSVVLPPATLMRKKRGKKPTKRKRSRGHTSADGGARTRRRCRKE